MSRSDEDVLRFIAASFPSVWALEVLLALKRERRPWTQGELVTSLRASELVVRNAIDALIAGGMASIERQGEDEGVAYLPVSGELDEVVQRVEQLYRTRPNRVRRVIVSAASPAATAFADAFKIRRGDDD